MSETWEHDALDDSLRRAFRGRAEPAAAEGLAARAVALAREQERAEAQEAERLAGWLARRRGLHRIVMVVAAMLIAGVVVVGWRGLAPLVSTVSSDVAANSSSTTSGDTGDTQTASTISTESSGTQQVLLIIGGLVVIAIGALRVQRAMGGSGLAWSAGGPGVPSLR